MPRQGAKVERQIHRELAPGIPHRLPPYYAQNLATVFHSFYKQCRVISQDEALTKARLKLVRATQISLARVLHLIGMVAPEKM